MAERGQYRRKSWAMARSRSALHIGVLAALPAVVSIPAGAEPEPAITAHRLSSPPVIDGRLDDEVWKEAAIIDEFLQDDPVAGAPASEKTVAYVGYDEDALYIGIRAHDREPDRIVARVLQEDAELYVDDSLYVAVDSLLDRQNAYQLILNPLGTKRDTRIENNSISRPEWDGIWYGDARRDGEGWTAEFAIPVKTLSIRPGNTHWGLNIFRMIRRYNEWVHWANISQDREFTDVRHFGDLEGLEGLHQGRGLDVVPAAAIRGDWNEDADDADLSLKPGGEVIYKLRQSLNASLLVNPDFSDTKVDLVQTNLTRFELFFPEQRDFFVRDADTFEFGGLREANGMPYFSRRVGLKGDVENPDAVDIDIGAKLGGRVGKYTVGLFNTQMDDFDPVVGDRNLTVARLARDVGRESRVGTLLTWGDPQSTRDNGLVGTDYRYRNSSVFGDMTFIADTFFMQSFTSGVDGRESAWGARLDFPNDRWNARLNYMELQENFNPALGFVNRPGIRNYEGGVRFRQRFKGQPLVRFMDWGAEWSITTDRDNDLESVFARARFLSGESQHGDKLELFFDYNEERLAVPFEIHPGVRISTGTHQWTNLAGKLETSDSRPVRVRAEWSVGDFYDGTNVDITGYASWRPIPNLQFAAERRYININLPAGDFDIEINRLWANVAFNPRLSWTNLLQHETESHFMTVNSQLRWIMTPGTELWLTFNHDWVREDGRYRSREADVTGKIFWTKRF